MVLSPWFSTEILTRGYPNSRIPRFSAKTRGYPHPTRVYPKIPIFFAPSARKNEYTPLKMNFPALLSTYFTPYFSNNIYVWESSSGINQSAIGNSVEGLVRNVEKSILVLPGSPNHISSHHLSPLIIERTQHPPIEFLKHLCSRVSEVCSLSVMCWWWLYFTCIWFPLNFEIRTIKENCFSDV